ncbi:MerC domain-containing protein [Hirschia maritima]|uniref:MerC domain-containing protein n=1 Tax=Hirschia maritima TaxID=1121961 RepID=UPI00039D5B1B|nr:MerC domain-containing protein [Hirschia maritima]
MKVQTTPPASGWADITAVALSFLCLAHCLLLPFLVSALPLLGPFSENEMVHKLLVLIAIPVSASVFFTSQNAKRLTPAIVALILTGGTLLILGAFVEMFEAYETNLTISGVILLSAAHISRMVARHKA